MCCYFTLSIIFSFQVVIQEVQKIVEIPVEKIVVVEKVVEKIVLVEKIVQREVPVEKIVHIEKIVHVPVQSSSASPCE